MVTALLLVLSAALDRPPLVEQDGVRVEVEVRSSLYAWTVTNLTAEPITRLEVVQANLYDPVAPAGWEAQIERHRSFRAWTGNPRRAIQPGQSRQFAATVDIRGAVLGTGQLVLGTRDEEQAILLQDVWTSAPLPRSQVVLVVGLILALAAGHVAGGEMSKRRHEREATKRPGLSVA